jgi:hypothetical protein
MEYQNINPDVEFETQDPSEIPRDRIKSVLLKKPDITKFIHIYSYEKDKNILTSFNDVNTCLDNTSKRLNINMEELSSYLFEDKKFKLYPPLKYNLDNFKPKSSSHKLDDNFLNNIALYRDKYSDIMTNNVKSQDKTYLGRYNVLQIPIKLDLDINFNKYSQPQNEFFIHICSPFDLYNLLTLNNPLFLKRVTFTKYDWVPYSNQWGQSYKGDKKKGTYRTSTIQKDIFDEDLYINEMSRLFFNILYVQSLNKCRELVWPILGMDFYHNYIKQGVYSDKNRLMMLKRRVIDKFIEIFKIMNKKNKMTLNIVIGDKENDILNLESIYNSVINYSKIKLYINKDAIDLANELSNKGKRVSLVIDENMDRIGNYWYDSKNKNTITRKHSITENIFRRSTNLGLLSINYLNRSKYIEDDLDKDKIIEISMPDFKDWYNNPMKKYDTLDITDVAQKEINEITN